MHAAKRRKVRASVWYTAPNKKHAMLITRTHPGAFIPFFLVLFILSSAPVNWKEGDICEIHVRETKKWMFADIKSERAWAVGWLSNALFMAQIIIYYNSFIIVLIKFNICTSKKIFIIN